MQGARGSWDQRTTRGTVTQDIVDHKVRGLAANLKGWEAVEGLKQGTR